MSHVAGSCRMVDIEKVLMRSLKFLFFFFWVVGVWCVVVPVVYLVGGEVGGCLLMGLFIGCTSGLLFSLGVFVVAACCWFCE